MSRSANNRFQDFFEEDKYILLKNYLYNYLLRKSAVEKSLHKEDIKLALEIGSGISPVMTRTNRIIYSDVSFGALQILKRALENQRYVVADGMKLPFKPGVFSHAICSEVLEHLQDDCKALNELSRVMSPSGSLILTVPHRKLYYSNDDRFVNHFRRYEIFELEEKLKAAGLMPMHIQKVLGPLEKVTMSLVVFCFSKLRKLNSKRVKAIPKYRAIQFFVPLFKWANRLFMGLVWLDARMMPRAFATVLLIKAQKK
ncbi:MAG: class I SAM-dependent methyltransferase [Desulfobacterales bacterium]|nr:class I SAM-dependent methyltransferase [Desulfobacterales bacterium]